MIVRGEFSRYELPIQVDLLYIHASETLLVTLRDGLEVDS